MNNSTDTQIMEGDCFERLLTLPAESFAACITDPPYNYEFIGHKWNSSESKRRMEAVSKESGSSTLVKNIPYGSGLAGGVRNERWYRRNKENIEDYRDWTEAWGREVFRVLKPGAYIAVFNSTRTVGQVQVALENVGFYARDILVYRRQSGIPRGLNLASKLRKLGHEVPDEATKLHSALRNEWEGVALLQKPLVKNYFTTYEAYGTGLMETINPDGGFQSNILEGFRPDSDDRKVNHPTNKPLALMKKLVSMLVPENQNVIDPFAGSGTTLLAAKSLQRSSLGIEADPDYVEIAKSRISDEKTVGTYRGRADHA